MTDFPDHVLLVLRVRILPDDVPAQARMKRALKALLRGYGCVCTDIRPLAGPSGSDDILSRLPDSASQSYSE